MGFIPQLDVVYLLNRDTYKYCVIKKPEAIPGEKTLMVREGCTVQVDGRWHYWRLPKPINYKTWLAEKRYTEEYSENPDFVVSQRLNKGKPGIPAPVFKARHGDNNWKDGNPMVIPSYVTEEMLGDLMVAHLQLSEEVQEGKPPKGK